MGWEALSDRNGCLPTGTYDILVVSSDGKWIATDQFTIEPRTVLIQPDQGQSKLVGQTDPVFTFQVWNSLIGSDTLTGKLGRESGEAAGRYQYTLGTLTAGDNYLLQLLPTDTFTIIGSGLLGDTNSDGKVNQTDLDLLYITTNYGLPKSSAANPQCDINGDGYINLIDAAILQQLIKAAA